MKNKISILENDIYLFPIVNSVNNFTFLKGFTFFTWTLEGVALLTSS